MPKLNVLVAGSTGYIGIQLIKLLVKHKYVKIKYLCGNSSVGKKISSYDNLRSFKNLPKIIRFDKKYLKNVDVVVHLANIANDPSVELNPALSWEVNVLATQKLVERSISSKVKQFIFASSGSVYGIKKEKKVTEDLSLVPISTYNKTKMIAERILKSYEKDIKIHCIRPATVCGFSPRMRLDVSVNMLAFQALKNNSMTVFGGNQIRPNIHIQDLINVYKHFISKPNLNSGFYNAGFENLKIIEIAKKVAKIIPSSIIIKKNNDPRSYRQDSTKLLSTGFKRRFSVDDAINDIKAKYESKKIKESLKCYTVKWMKKIKL